MRRSVERIISVLLVVCMCATILFGALPVAEAVTPGYSVSSAYKASSYYSALLDVELTGDQRVDIINVALSQAGYCEGSYSGDTGGADDGSYNNYTEYNYWYNNYVTSDMPVGGSYAPWCATFVSWCARQANIPTSILNNSTVAGHASHAFNIKFYSGSSTLASSSDNDSYFMGYNYTPKRGDLFYTRSWSHVGLVVDSDGTYVTTVEGNTNDGGSAEGLGVFVRTRYVDDLYFGVPEYVESYASTCDFYPAHCKITIDSSTPINSQPCSVSTEADSVNLGTATAGQTYTATGLYRNGYGNYWYRVESGLGESCYLYAGDTTFVEQIISDITFTDYDVPNGHVSGSTFSVTGTIASEFSGLDTASCYIYSGFGKNGGVVTGDSDSVSGNRYSLVNSDIDFNTSFGSLGTGSYTYEIAVTYTNHYATSNTTTSYDSGTIVLLSEYFMVVPSSVDQSTCSHSYTTTVVEAGTCTQPGKAVQACTKCGLVNETTTGADGHSYGSWTTVKATCTADGYQKRTCSACGNVETVKLNATGHSYDAVKTEATCSSYAKYTMTCGSCGDSYTMTADQMASTWLEEIPGGMDPSLFRSQTQYRWSDYQTTTSYATSLAGYTLKSSDWEKSGSGSVQYVPDWPAGFSTSSSLYAQYDKESSKVTASQTNTDKTSVDSDTVVGYLYYHWCYADSYYSVASSSGSYTTFHAYYDTTDPNEFTCDVSDYSYKTAHSSCSNSDWFFVTEVYQQDYTTYKKLFTYERWTDWSAWSATVATASDTRKVETRTVYQLKEASLGAHSWSNGVCSSCGKVCDHPGYSGSGVCATCGKSVAHDYVATVTPPTCTAQGYTTYKCSICGSSYVGDYTSALSHSFVDGTCTTCGTTCSHSWSSGSCANCGAVCKHSYSNNVCSICGTKKAVKDYYLFGWIDGADYACEGDWQNLGEYKFVDGKLTTIFEQDSYVALKSGDNQDWYMLTAYYGENVTAATLFNTSTGANEKLFVPGGKVVTFTLKDNGDDTYTLSYTTSSCTHPAHDATGSCTSCGADVGHSYVDGVCTLCGAIDPSAVVQPTLTLKYPSLSFESEILYNVYYIAENVDDVVEMGLATFDTQLTNGTVGNATDVIPGYETDGTLWKVGTNGISAKNLGDTVWFKVYAKLSDGSYVYSAMKSYSAVSYANTILGRSTSSSYMKSLVVAMLNYGAEAQKYFGHNTDALMNASLTSAQKALVSAYDESMVDPVVSVDSTKAGSVVYDGSSFVRRAPSVSFDSAFSINFYFTTANVPEGDVKLYYWTLEDYNAATTLKPSNATGKIIMTPTDTENQYWGQVSGIAAKELDETVFVAGFYTYGGKTYSTGVLNYSIGRYCEGIAANSASPQQALAQATAVYGYHAKEYFANL